MDISHCKYIHVATFEGSCSLTKNKIYFPNNLVSDGI